jgi:hypothetical protein
MKKARIILSAVAVFAVAGGAFAFKAVKFGAPNRVYTSYTTTTAPGGPLVTRCSTIPFASTTLGGVPSLVYTSTTTQQGVPGILCVTNALTATSIVTTNPGE